MITLGLLIFLIISYIEYRIFNYGDINSISYGSVAKLKWNQVKAIYNSNPKRWRFSPIVEQGYNFIETHYKALLFNAGNAWGENNRQIVRIQLSFFDYLKFLHAKKHKINGYSKGIEMILQATQKDINDLTKMANKEIQNAKYQIEEIKENFQKGVTLEL